MAGLVCKQCGAFYPPQSNPAAGAQTPSRCRFCGDILDTQTPPAKPQVAPVTEGIPPVSQVQTAAPKHENLRAGISHQQRLQEPFEPLHAPVDVPRPSSRWPRRVLLLLVLVGLGVYAQQSPFFSGPAAFWRAFVRPGIDPVAQQKLAQGYLALERGSSRALAEAEQDFQQALQLQPQYPAAYVGLTDVHLAMGQALEDAAEQVPYFSRHASQKDRKVWEQQAREQHTQAQQLVVTAAASAQVALQLAPNLPEAQRAMADVLQRQGQADKANMWRQAAERLAADNAYLMASKAEASNHGDDAQQAFTLWQQTVAQAPQNNRWRYKLAQSALQHDKREQALEQLNTILQTAPEHELAQQMLMRLEPAASNADKVTHPLVLSFAPSLAPAAAPPAPETLPPSAPETPQHADATPHGLNRWILEGRTLASNMRQTVQKSWHQLVDAAPTDSTTSLASSHQEAPGLQAAHPEPQAPTPAAPEPALAPVPVTPKKPMIPNELRRMSVPTLLEHGQTLRQAQKSDQALMFFQQATQSAPQDQNAWLGYGFCQLDLQQPQQAVDTFQQAVALASWQAEGHFGLAEALRQTHHAREAVQHYRRYLMIEPNGPYAQQARQKLEDLSK